MKKVITYNTPRSIQALKQKEPNKWYKKNKVCKVTKGEHQFTEISVEYLFNRPWMKQWRCKCGKKGKYEFIDPPKWLKK